MGLVKALLWVFEEVADRADHELYDEDGVRAELMELYLKLEAGTLSEDDFDEREAELVERLEEIEDHQGQRSRHAS